MLSISNLHVSADGKEILHGVTLTIKPGEIHVVMGPNGSGKSTLLYTLMGHSSYKIVRNKDQKEKTIIELDGKNISKLSPDERARLGLFLAFQTPVTIPGVTVGKLMRRICQLRKPKDALKKYDISFAVSVNKRIDEFAEKLHIKPELLTRDLHDNFSGGEKKKIEALQMLLLQPKYAFIDEIDTGLDVDALKIVAGGISTLAENGSGIVLITHYNRMLKYLEPHYVHIMVNGMIVKNGTTNLAYEIEKKGYSIFN